MPVFKIESVKPADEYIARHYATCIGELRLPEWALSITDDVWSVIKSNPKSHLATRFRQLKTVARLKQVE